MKVKGLQTVKLKKKTKDVMSYKIMNGMPYFNDKGSHCTDATMSTTVKPDVLQLQIYMDMNVDEDSKTQSIIHILRLQKF